MNKYRKYIIVKGIVQGVGFRPFVYNLAIKNNLKGWVNNTAQGVFIDIEGYEINIEKFLFELTNNPPPLAKVNEIIIEEKEIANFHAFDIRFSKEGKSISTHISPDFSICDDCKDDILNDNNRRYRYPFTNCTNCGPRFSIIKKLPYDREITTMAKFKMCKNCEEEYKNPLNRRFHAQPNACPVCGPKVWLVDRENNKINIDDPIIETIKLIKEGNIIGIKGLGGFNLVCDGTSYKVIERLRERKKRPTKPLAVMIRDIDIIKKYCTLSEKEEEVINSNKRPIIILNRLTNSNLPDNLAPLKDTLGVMLPYTPLHYLLFDENIEILVMTSANVSGEPMLYRNEEAIDKLKNIVDYYLLHDRDIYIPVDDSVVRVYKGEERVIRPARGYAPYSINLEGGGKILASGSHLKNTFSISNNESIFISQYIGDMNNLETYETFENNMEHFKEIYKIEPEALAYDLHPDYWCKDIVNSFCGKKIAIQHHHAHIVSCMADNNINETVIGVAYDGTGYGEDGNIWGGEFLVCNRKEFIRVGHLNYLPLPGGESAIKEPWKIAVGQLYKVCKEDLKKNLPKCFDDKPVDVVIAMLKGNVNSPLTSSIGRLFDGVAGLLGFIDKISFEGEAAIYLENIADKGIKDSYQYEIESTDDIFKVNSDLLLIGIIMDMNKNIKSEVIAAKFHNTVINFTVESCRRISEINNIKKVVLSGGVFHNELLLDGICKRLELQGFEVFTHKLIPNNDSGISIGQLLIARENL